MFSNHDILAAGIPPGLIFGVVVVAIWALGLIFNKSSPKTDALKKPSQQASDLAAARRRIREEQAAQKPPVTPRIAKKIAAKRQAAASKAPPPLPTSRPAAARPLTPVIAASADRAALNVVAVPRPTRHGGASSETARHVRAMLQHRSVGEAFLLGEVLGKPKSMD